MPKKSAFGDLLRRLREARSLTHRELAEASGVNINTISTLERGVSQRPRVDTIEMLAKGFGLTGAEAKQFFAVGRGRIWVPADPPPTPHNLPRDLSTFIGRAREIGQIADLAAAHRLVTLTGTAGSGKTRLALAAAAALLADFPDGVYFVDLAPLRDPALVAATIVATLGVPDGGRRSTEERLIAYLRDKAILLILDNFEHLLKAKGLVTTLMIRTTKVHLLVTSRRALRLPSEMPFSVPPLDLPARGQAPQPPVLAGYEAVQLFTTRAQFARQGAALAPETLATVAQICHLLDGLPLAIELAAVRCAILSPDKILDLLRDRFSLLTQGRHGGPARHRTLQAALEWSYHLLEPGAERLLNRLAVFAGGCTLDAVEAICNPGQELGITTLDGLQELVQQNLLRAIFNGDENRYTILESIRELAQQKLVESGEYPDCSTRHLLWYRAKAEEALPHWDGGVEQTHWLTYFDTEYANVQAASDWASRHDPERNLQIVGNLGIYWLIRKGEIEGITKLERALALWPNPTTARAYALYSLGFLLIWRDIHTARRTLEEGISISRALGDEHLTATILRPLIYAAIAAGDPTTGKLLEECKQLAIRLNDAALGATLDFVAGLAAEQQGQLAQADVLMTKALAVTRATGNLFTTSLILPRLGLVHLARGMDDEAEAHYRELASAAERVGYNRYNVMSGILLGTVAEWRGDWSTAETLYSESFELAEAYGDLADTGDLAIQALTLASVGRLDLHHGRTDAAVTNLDRAKITAQTVQDYGVLTEILPYLWLALWRQGQRLRAVAEMRETLNLWYALGYQQGFAKTLTDVGLLLSEFADHRSAMTCLGLAERIRQTIGAQLPRAELSRYNSGVAQARTALSPQVFDAAWEAGEAMPLDEAIAAAERWLTERAAQDTAVPAPQ